MSNHADTGPAIFVHSADVLEAFEIDWEILALLLGSLVANGEGLIDVVNAEHFEVVGAFFGAGGGDGHGCQTKHG